MKWNWDLPKQKFLVENGATGDCWRCCVAAILQIPAEEVPHFLELEKDGGKDMHVATQEWLSKRGYFMVCSDHYTVYGLNKDWFDDLPLIAAGPTERSKGLGKHHAVVMLKDEIVYDPHPSNAGLTYISDKYLIARKL
jgi:hypothetical protein